MICSECGNPMVRHPSGDFYYCPECSDAESVVIAQIVPDYGQRLIDGFALIRASEDPEIDPSEHTY